MPKSRGGVAGGRRLQQWWPSSWAALQISSLPMSLWSLWALASSPIRRLGYMLSLGFHTYIRFLDDLQ